MSRACPNLKEGDTFCVVCPNRPELSTCLDSRYPKLADAKPSFASRIGLLLVCCIALALIPVVFRDIVTIRSDTHSTPHDDVTLVLTIISCTAGFVMVVGSIYGIYVSLFGARPKKSLDK